MRIAGGEFRGRAIAVPRTGLVRPTQDRVREALFSILAPEIPGADFLDLFAGSGAVGVEALSRGAASATFVERDRRNFAALEKNLDTILGTRRGAANAVCADAIRWMAAYSGPGFSVAFADPPYAATDEGGCAAILEAAAAHGVVRMEGLFAAETSSGAAPVAAAGWELLRDRAYGKTRICIWRRTQT